MRISWHELWRNMARLVALRSSDEKMKVGCVIVKKDNTAVISLGYNGDYKGGPNRRESLETGKSGFIHAEVNALIKANFSEPDQVMYLTHSPCRDCARLIVNSGVREIFFEREYVDSEEVITFLRSVGISINKLEEE